MMEPRERIHEGINPTRLKLDAKRSVGSLLVLLLGGIVGILGAAWLVSQVSTTVGRSTYEASFAVRDATGIVPKVDQLRYRGIVAGTITKLERTATGRLVVTAKIRKEYGPIYHDAIAQLRPETPLQDMYLDVVDPGTPRAGTVSRSDPLPEARVDTSVNLDDVLDAFQSDERARMRELLDGLGNGLKDRGAALKATFVQLAPLLRTAGEISSALDHRSTATARLVHNVGILTGDLGHRDAMLKRLVREGSATFGTLQQGSPDLDATLRELPGTFTEIRTSLDAVRGVLGDVDTAVGRLDPVADRLPGSLRALRRLNTTLAPAIRSLDRPVGDLVPLAQVLTPVSHDLAGTANALAPQVPPVDRTTVDLVRCEKGVIGFFQWNTSLTKLQDLRGPIPRGNLALALPDSGLTGATRIPGGNCVVGAPTIGGRPVEPKDKH